MTGIHPKERKRRSLRCVIVRVFLLTVIFLIVYDCGLITVTITFLHDNLAAILPMYGTRQRFLCVTFQGGLGNLLFQYAFAYATSKSNNMTMFCTRNDVKQLQEIFYVPDCTRYYNAEKVCKKAPSRNSRYDCGFDESIVTLNKTDLKMDGYFQSWVYWKNEEFVLREYFKIKQHVLNASETLMASALNNLGYSRSNATLVGIHIRRGDIITKDYLIKYGYDAPGQDYLKRAMEYIRSKVKGDIVYVVCSNDMTWTRRVIQDPNVAFMEGGSREIDFALLASCDHLIMTVGTFGWWVGWMVKGIVVYYDKPFKNGTQLEKRFTKDYRTTLYYPHWVGFS
ncbi:galactoside 2-alpha-L-fucosyltransferase SEC1-like [Gigantopelta aegis]|uniref:galactoside 2-alpha-L-fucosyltransferase SEC1-like n=1 Tax=Gigantopelta aegis TaxID=1735272 RepID=UPI001B88AC49|nr:galactoside 2-alpha-L-fucosyltransferase SEC1-like [Gigantopelta aegis]